jgi:hypothetical protein
MTQTFVPEVDYDRVRPHPFSSHNAATGSLHR